MVHDPRSRAFQALAHLLVSDGSLADSLRAVAKVVQDAVPVAAYAGITMGDDRDRPVTPIFTDPEVPEMDQAQYDSGRGPCLDAWRRAEVIRLDDLSDDPDTYPEFSEAALARGVCTTLSVPLVSDGKSMGALNLYGTEVGGFSQEDEQLVADITPAVAAFMVNARAYWGAFALSEQLNEAMGTRAVIEQAKGVLIATTPGLDADGAIEMLKNASQRGNMKLRDIAQQIVDRRSGRSPDRT